MRIADCGLRIEDWEMISKKFGVKLEGESKAVRKPGLLRENGWRIQLMAKAGSLTDEFNFAGVSDDAKDRYDDQRDLLEIPMLLSDTEIFPSSYVNLYFTSQSGGNYASDYKSKVEKEQVWEFIVERKGEKEEVELTWKIDRVPQQDYLYLKDKDTGNLLDMQKINGYKFVGDKRQFNLIVTTQPIPVIQPAITIGSAYCYPNPTRKDEITFVLPPGKVTIQIFNIAGEKVCEEIVPNGGTWPWECKNSANEKVSSGIYIYLIKDPAGNEKVGKLGIIK
ncbi:MAG: T9SS type A sorting domain-containing protein [Nitrospirota bacterium]